MAIPLNLLHPEEQNKMYKLKVWSKLVQFSTTQFLNSIQGGFVPVATPAGGVNAVCARRERASEKKGSIWGGTHHNKVERDTYLYEKI